MARAVTSMTFKFYGNMSFNDRTSGPVEVTLAYNHKIANPFSVDNLTNFELLKRDMASVLTAMFATFSPKTVTLTPATPVATKTVTDVALMMSGSVSYDDRTQDSFVVEYLNGVTNFFPTSTTQDWADMMAFDTALLTESFEQLVGVGNATLA